MKKEERDKLIRAHNQLKQEHVERVMLGRKGKIPRATYAENSEYSKKEQAIRQEYSDKLPEYIFSRCPFCGSLLKGAFDPWGLDGFWWQENLSGSTPDLKACEHFIVLTGSLNLNKLPPFGGDEDSYPGPEVPYIIPKVLEVQTMTAVVSSIQMYNGYTAYPIAYFMEKKPQVNAFAQPWGRTSCNFTTADGRPAFTYFTDPWDFELLPWVAQNKLKWIAPNDPENKLHEGTSESFPYADLPGLRLYQTIKNDKLFTKTTPNNEKIDPFNE